MIEKSLPALNSIVLVLRQPNKSGAVERFYCADTNKRGVVKRLYDVNPDKRGAVKRLYDANPDTNPDKKRGAVKMLHILRQPR